MKLLCLATLLCLAAADLVSFRHAYIQSKHPLQDFIAGHAQHNAGFQLHLARADSHVSKLRAPDPYFLWLLTSDPYLLCFPDRQLRQC